MGTDKKTVITPINNEINTKTFGFNIENLNNSLKRKTNTLRKENNDLIKYLNYLYDENDKMEKNIELEKKKYDSLNKTYKRNTKLIKKYKLKFRHDLFDMYNEIDTNLNQIYDTYNQYSKEKTSEDSDLLCKICSNNKINIAINCGHAMCHSCYNKITSDYQKELNDYNDYLNDNDGDINTHFDFKPELKCPECRSDITDHHHLYL